MKILNVNYEDYVARRDAIALDLTIKDYDKIADKLNNLNTAVVIEALFQDGYKMIRACRRHNSNDIYVAVVNERRFSVSYIVAQFGIVCDQLLEDVDKQRSCHVAVYEEHESERLAHAPSYVYVVTDELDGPDGMDNPSYARNRRRNDNWNQRDKHSEKTEAIEIIDIYNIIKDVELTLPTL